jgi:hypothetical protein
MKKAEARGTAQVRQWLSIAALGMLPICSLSLNGCTPDAAAEQATRADLVAFVDTVPLDHFERPSVLFPHDLHTEVMKERKEDCTLCHPAHPDGRLSFSYERLDNRDEEGADSTDVRLVNTGDDEIIDLYHDNCIGCHKETASTGAAAGPLACGDCHRRQPAYLSSREPFGFDKSLHYRHVKAAQEKCEACHHEYDEAKKELVYVEGKESSCRDCHRQETEENRSAFKLAAHEACIGCHREPAPEIKTETDSVRPQLCVACHDLQQRLAIEQIEEPPRLKRGQDDFLLLSASKADLDASKLKTVPFSHLDHEQTTDSCRTCHHETLDRCSECHTLKGSEESEGVTLYQAMHATMSDHSCVGCHETEKAAPECAGCHTQMEQGRLPEEGCDICHAGPLPELLESERSRYRTMDDFRPGPSEIALSFALDDIPEIVEIGSLSNEYEPAKMPHRKIVEKLTHYISENSTATYFHGHQDIVCQGCHHQSPVGEKPPLCESCHGAAATEPDLLKPGLQGAYHRQCLGCHQSMDIQKPEDCSGCHAEKKEAIQTAASSLVR